MSESLHATKQDSQSPLLATQADRGTGDSSHRTLEFVGGDVWRERVRDGWDYWLICQEHQMAFGPSVDPALTCHRCEARRNDTRAWGLYRGLQGVKLVR